MKKITLFASFATLLSINGAFAQNNVVPQNGNVGIGTTSPSAKLQVSGSVRVDSTLIVSDSVHMASSATVGEDLKVSGNLYIPNIPSIVSVKDETILVTNSQGLTEKSTLGTLSQSLYSFSCAPIGGVVQSPTWANGPNKLFSGCPEVLVGIGLTSPTRTLEVNGTTKISGHTWLETSLSLGADVNGFSKFFIRNSNSSAAIEIDNTGNTKQYPKLLYFEYDNDGTEIIKVQNTAQNYVPFLLNASGQMTINNGTTNIFELASDGQLIIRNATQKNFQFDVNGLFRARRVRVDAETWADYVFEPNYKLMPLNEVKNFVATNKHLPGVPSEQEVVEKGIDLAEMNTILIQKIEELMLHLIDQSEQTAALKAEIEALKQKIAELEAGTGTQN